MATLVEALKQIHELCFSQFEWNEEAIVELMTDNELEFIGSDDSFWLTQLLKAALRKQNLKLYFQNVGDGATNFLAHLEADYGWSIEDYGEGIEIVLTNLGVKIFISREAIDPLSKNGCCSGNVALLKSSK